MCDPVTGAVVASSVFSAGSNIAAGIGERQMLSAQALADDQQAKSELMASSERARRIRMNGQKFLAEQRVQYANSGVEGGTGSPLEVGKADAAEIELDALTEMYGGTQRAKALTTEAALKRKRGVAAQTSGVLKGVSDILQTAAVWGSLGGTGAGTSASKIPGPGSSGRGGAFSSGGIGRWGR